MYLILTYNYQQNINMNTRLSSVSLTVTLAVTKMQLFQMNPH